MQNTNLRILLCGAGRVMLLLMLMHEVLDIPRVIFIFLEPRMGRMVMTLLNGLLSNSGAMVK